MKIKETAETEETEETEVGEWREGETANKDVNNYKNNLIKIFKFGGLKPKKPCKNSWQRYIIIGCKVRLPDAHLWLSWIEYSATNRLVGGSNPSRCAKFSS